MGVRVGWVCIVALCKAWTLKDPNICIRDTFPETLQKPVVMP